MPHKPRNDQKKSIEAACQCYWCNRTRGMTPEEAQAHNDKALALAS